MNRFESEGLFSFLVVVLICGAALVAGVVFLLSHVGFIGLGL